MEKLVKPAERAFAPNTALILAMAILAFYCFRNVMTGAPIMGSDEYAYSILARHPGADLFTLDPYLQRIDNRLFFALQHFWTSMEGGSGVLPMRMLHLFELLASGGFLYKAFEGLAERSSRAWAFCAAMLLPSSFYVLTVLPETDLVFLGAMAGFVLIRFFNSAPVMSSAVVGLISGFALLIKPHAIAWVPAILMTIAFMGWVARDDRDRLEDIVSALGFFLGGWYLGFVIGWWASGAGLSFNPADALGLEFYGGIVSKAGQSGFIGKSLQGFVELFASHLLVLGAVFAPAMAALLLACRDLFGRNAERDEKALISAIFVLAMLVVHLVMVSYFTASVGEKRSSEAMRLHGRYLGTILIFLPFFYFRFVERAQVRSARIFAVVGIVLIGLFYVVVLRHYKIFPWDYPELFAFFTSPNHYAWAFGTGVTGLGRIALIGCVAGFAVVLVRPDWLRTTMALQLLLVLLIGNVQMQRWLNTHTDLNAATVKSAEVVGKLVAPALPGDGLLIGDERYGRLSFTLFAMGNAPRVLVRDAGSAITADDIKGAHWVVLAKPYDVKFDYRNAIAIGDLTLYPLSATSPAISIKSKELWHGSSLALKFSDPALWGQMQGFNKAEVWGAWTARPQAEVELPVIVSGRVRLKLFGWVLPESLGNSIKVSAGGAVQEVRMTGSGTDYVIEMDITQPTDRIRFETPVVRPASSARDMGVALRGVEIERNADATVQ